MVAQNVKGPHRLPGEGLFLAPLPAALCAPALAAGAALGAAPLAGAAAAAAAGAALLHLLFTSLPVEFPPGPKANGFFGLSDLFSPFHRVAVYGINAAPDVRPVLPVRSCKQLLSQSFV